jgi:hypothetical protein
MISLCDIAACIVVAVDRRFTGAYCLQDRGDVVLES